MPQELPTTPRRFPHRLAASLRWVVALVLLAGTLQAVAAPRQLNVLALYSSSRLLPALSVIDETLDAVLHQEASLNVVVLNEFVDLDGRRGPDYADRFAESLRNEYAGKPIDVIVAVRAPALKFLLARRDSLFPGVPIVHVIVEKRDLAGLDLPADVVGAPINPQPERTLELALALQPGVRRVVVITGTSKFDHEGEAILRAAFAPFEKRVGIEYWAGLPLPTILERIAKLPADTIAFLPGMREDGTGQYFVPQRVAADVVAASSVPVWGATSNFRESGTMGGYVPSTERAARQAADLVLRLLKGDPASALAVPAALENSYILNMFQLRSFGLPESALPAGAVLRFRQPSLWDTYRWQIVGVALLLLLQATLIGGLLVQRRNRRKAEGQLRESEVRMNLAATATGLGIWVLDFKNNDHWASPQHRGLLGIGTDEVCSLDRFYEAVHPDDRDHVRQALDAVIAGDGEYDVLYRVPLEVGHVRWIASRGRMGVDKQGQARHLRSVSSDVTAHKEAELEAQRHRNELAHMSRVGMLGQLSGSIAHELNQPLTAILSNAQAALRFMKSDRVDLDEVRDILTDIVTDDKRAGDVILRLRALFERGEAKQEAVDLNELVRQVLQLLHGDLVSRNVSVMLELFRQLPPVRGDRVQLQQLLLNLVLNACEAMADEPLENRRLTLRTRVDDDGRIEATVADRGKGIPTSTLATIFDPFVTTKKFGIGLGLVIARSIVSAHGGSISVANNADRGASFTFTLNLADEFGTPAASDSGAPELSGPAVVGR